VRAFLARRGGDELVVLVQEIERDDAAVIEPLDIQCHDCRVTASIGVAMYPAHGEDEQSLMKAADLATYLANEEGKNNFQFYSPDISTRSYQKMTLESGLRGIACDQSQGFYFSKPPLPAEFPAFLRDRSVQE